MLFTYPNTITRITNISEYREAMFSIDMFYRYLLVISWDIKLPLVQFIGLNPSTADEIKDDNTVRRCKDFSKSWGFGGMVMTNAFAYRETDPKLMKKHPSPIGEHNDAILKLVYDKCEDRIAAWGKDGFFLNRATEITSNLPFLNCLGKNKDSSPKHPLYLAKTTQRISL